MPADAILVQTGLTTTYRWEDCETGKASPYNVPQLGTQSEIDKNAQDTGFMVLSLDGGGVRGYLQVCLLADLEAKMNKPIGEVAHLIAGTSVGGLLTMLLLKRNPDKPEKCQYTAAWLKGTFPSLAEQVFEKKRESLLWRIFKTIFSIFWDLEHPEYSREGLLAVGRQYLQGELARNARTNFCIATYELGVGLSRTLFVSLESAAKGFFNDITMAALGTITSAAPIYFDPAPFNGRLFMDGGVWCNDPTLAAFESAQRIAPLGKKIHVLSLGTGISPTPLDKNLKRKHWGLLEVVPSLLDIFMNTQTEGVNTEMMKERVGLASYHRFQPHMANVPSLDAADAKTWALLDQVAQDIIDTPEWQRTVELWQQAARFAYTET